MKKITAILFSGITTFCFVSLMTSCGDDDHKTPGLEFMPDMYRSPGYETYSASPLTADSLSAMAPVKGTVSRNQYMLFNYANTPEAYELAGVELKNPLAATPENLAEGKRLFEIFCIHCHGIKGDGKGSLVISSKGGDGFPVPSYYDDAHKDLPDGKMFFSIILPYNL